MELLTDVGPWTDVDADWLVVGIPRPPEWTGQLGALNEALDGQLERLRARDDLTGKHAETLVIPDAPGIGATRLLLVGLGKLDQLTPARLDRALMTAIRDVSSRKGLTVAVGLPDLNGASLSAGQAAAIAAACVRIGSAGQDLYKTEPSRFALSTARILASPDTDEATLRTAAERGGILGDAVNLTRELVNRPAQDIYPESFAERAEQLAGECALECEVFDVDRLAQERMNAMLAVAAGSERPARMVVLEHRGGGDAAPTLGLCGKGVTFDSGGLSLKSNDGMKSMKSDMAGAATVLGAMTAIARLNLPVNVTGFMGMVENMPSGTSYKVGDVLTARNGVTIEVLNTDAEGRLVLADVLSYAVDRGADKLIDLATLTGACVVALGEDVTGLFTNEQAWCDEVIAAAGRAGEDVWQLPMFEQYGELIKSDVADIKNTGGRWAGAITAAKLLERFVGDKPWTHLDIAGPSFAPSNKKHREGGGTGCMVRTLVEIAAGFSA